MSEVKSKKPRKVIPKEGSFPFILDHLMKKNHDSIRELSRITGLSRSAIGFYLAGSNEPKLSNLKQIAEFYGVTLDYLAGMPNSVESVDVEVQQIAKLLNLSKESIDLIIPDEGYLAEHRGKGLDFLLRNQYSQAFLEAISTAYEYMEEAKNHPFTYALPESIDDGSPLFLPNDDEVIRLNEDLSKEGRLALVLTYMEEAERRFFIALSLLNKMFYEQKDQVENLIQEHIKRAKSYIDKEENNETDEI